jgi:hypothetical protein
MVTNVTYYFIDKGWHFLLLQGNMKELLRVLGALIFVSAITETRK